MAKSTIKTLKESTWVEFSLYIRARDANSHGIVKCCTCEKKMFWKGVECQAGHYVRDQDKDLVVTD